MTEYVLRFEPAPEMMSRAMVAWAKPQRSRNAKIKGIVLGVILYLFLVFCVVLLLHHDIITRGALFGVVVGLFGGIALWAIIHQKHAKKITGFTHDAIARHGMTDASFSSESVKLTSQISETRMGWLCFDEVMALTDATVLRAGGVVYAIPDAALPEAVTPKQFRADLKSWMEAAQ